MLDLLDVQMLAALLPFTDSPEAPEPQDVKAGWTALVIWLSMAVVVGLLGWSMIRRLKRSLSAKESGVYGDPRHLGSAPAYDVDTEPETDSAAEPEVDREPKG